MATTQERIAFYADAVRAFKLRTLADNERRTITTLMNEAMDLLFASRDNQHHSRKA